MLKAFAKFSPELEHSDNSGLTKFTFEINPERVRLVINLFRVNTSF
jgi:hypothetical protein